MTAPLEKIEAVRQWLVEHLMIRSDRVGLEASERYEWLTEALAELRAAPPLLPVLTEEQRRAVNRGLEHLEWLASSGPGIGTSRELDEDIAALRSLLERGSK